MLACCLLSVLHFLVVMADVPLVEQDACTSFRLLVDNSPVIGKNLDWSIEDGILSLNSRGLCKRALVDSTHLALEWVSEYASISFNQFGREFPLGGMNEAGLVVEELSYWPSQYPPPGERPSINELQWIQLQLDVHASVAEVIEHISEVQVRPLLFGLHYFVVDASGDAAVIEFLDGELIIHYGPELPVPVLTNDTYRNSVRYLSSYVGFGGKRTVSDGPESPERFVRAATMLQEFEQGQRSTAPVMYAFQILREVAQDDTQWSIVYDVGSRTVHFTTASIPVKRRISLAILDLDCSGQAIALDLKDHYEGDVCEKLSPWTREDQDRLISRVFEKMAKDGSIDDRKHQRIREGMVRLGSTVPQCEEER